MKYWKDRLKHRRKRESKASRACYPKKQYATIKEAENASKRLYGRRKAYQCKVCGGFHISPTSDRHIVRSMLGYYF